jgi:hypothetical protein
MEKISSQQFFRFWAILGFSAVILIWFLPWRFQTNDDELMMWLVSGAYTGTPESYAVFIHPLLSWLFSKLYTFFPAIPWYPMTWFGVMYVSYVVFLRLVWGNSKTKNYHNLSALVTFCLLVHFLLFLQFTIVAGFLAFSGYYVLVFSPEKEFRKSSFFPWILLSFSILIRWESFVLISFGVGLYLVIFKSDFLKKHMLHIGILVMLFIVLVSGKTLWENNSEYAEFRSYNKARAAVSDHPVTFRLLTEERIESNSEWFYFSHWMMDDDSISTEKLTERKRKLDKELGSLIQIESSFSRLRNVLKTEVFKSVFSLFILIGFAFAKGTIPQKTSFFLIWVSFLLVFNHFYILNGRVIILFVLPFALPVISAAIDISRSTLMIWVTLLSILLAIHFKNFLTEGKGRAIMQSEFNAVLRQIPPKSLIVLEGYKENYLGILYSQSNPVPFLSFGWISKSPFQSKALQRFNLEEIGATNSFYLVGVDVHEEFFFPLYMNSRFGEFSVAQKTNFANFILFEYQRD